MRAAFYDSAVDLTPLVAAATEYGTFLVRTGDNLGRSVFVNRIRPEMIVVDEAVGVLTALGLGVEGRLFIDVGANVGTATVSALRHPFRGAVAFEPEFINYQLLQMNLILNGLAGRVTTRRTAISDQNRQAELIMIAGSSGEGHLRSDDCPRQQEDLLDASGQEFVQTATLDSMAADGTFDHREVSLTWLDVQGHEARVLRGAGVLVAAALPVVLELWPAELRRCGDLDELHRLAQASYTHFVDLRSHHSELTVRPIRELSTFTDELENRSPDALTDILIVRI